jgi:hypothetical protein
MDRVLYYFSVMSAEAEGERKIDGLKDDEFLEIGDDD